MSANLRGQHLETVLHRLESVALLSINFTTFNSKQICIFQLGGFCNSALIFILLDIVFIEILELVLVVEL